MGVAESANFRLLETGVDDNDDDDDNDDTDDDDDDPGADLHFFMWFSPSRQTRRKTALQNLQRIFVLLSKTTKQFSMILAGGRILK